MRVFYCKKLHKLWECGILELAKQAPLWQGCFCVELVRKELLKMLAVGTQAPAFTLPDKDGNNVSLSDFLGKKVVLYFYPKDSTPGCTRQAQAFRDAFTKFVEAGAVIIGISKDSVKSHLNFATKQELPFILLSDTEHTVLEAYEVWQEKKLYGKVSMGVVRSVYVIDEEGKIAAAWTKVKPEQSAVDALEFVCSCSK